jgi:hypothetical protein
MSNLDLRTTYVCQLKPDELSKINGGWWWQMLRDAAVIEGLKWMFKNMPEVEPGFYHPGKM